MKVIQFGDKTQKVELGDTVVLKNQEQEVVKCQETGVLMLNIDSDQLAKGDLTFIKSLGLTISNPDTDKPVALGVDFIPNTFGEKVHQFFLGKSDEKLEDLDEPEEEEESTEDDSEDDSEDDDDSSFFSPSHSSDSFGGFGGGSSFGGFGGGGFSGAGASAGF